MTCAWPGAATYTGQDLAAGRELRASLARPSHAYRSWLSRYQRMERAGRGHWQIVREIGPEPERGVCPGEDAGDVVWLPRHTPGAVAAAPPDAPPGQAHPCGLTLRDYQRPALAAWWRAGRVGTIVAPCGSGKTALGTVAIAHVETPALVLVHAVDLQAQWIERLSEALPGAAVGRVGGGRKERDGDAVVATIQTLATWDPARLSGWASRFGLVVLDEAHHAPAATWARVLACCPGPYRLGLTATPGRRDGLGEWVLWSCGPIVHEIRSQGLQECGAVLVPEVRTVLTGWSPRVDGAPWHEIMAALVKDSARNDLICREVEAQVQRDRVVLVLTGRVSHARYLAEQLGGVVLVGESGRRDRAAALEGARSREVQVLCATTVADEGLDVPALDTVILAYPERVGREEQAGGGGKVAQRIGRALRPSPGKSAEVIDLVDAWGPLQGWARQRAALYRRLGWR